MNISDMDDLMSFSVMTMTDSTDRTCYIPTIIMSVISKVSNMYATVAMLVNMKCQGVEIEYQFTDDDQKFGLDALFWMLSRKGN